MKGFRIDQLMAGGGDGDATTNAALIMRDALRAAGYPSDLYAPPANISPTLREDVAPLENYRPAAQDICIYQYGIASAVDQVFTASPARKILVYHNITPADYFDGFDDDIAARLREARRAFANLAGQARKIWAVSRYNARDLADMGVTNARVFELPFSTRHLDIPLDPLLLARRQAPVTTFLFVGRVAPNKRIEELIQAFAWYHLTINRQSRLLIVGSSRSCPRYYTMLQMMIGDLDLPNICLEGFASPAGLNTYYQLADLYVNASGHEGYCAPLLEAMYKGIPVISRSSGGVPEAMAGAGVQYTEATPRELAECMHLVLSDPALRQSILTTQQQRVQQATNRDVAAELQTLIDEVLA